MTDPTPKANYEARLCPGIPTDCCDYGVISHATGKEVCRVWNEEDARRIADLLNAALPSPATDAGEVRKDDHWALGRALDLIDSLYREYGVSLDSTDALVAQEARNIWLKAPPAAAIRGLAR